MFEGLPNPIVVKSDGPNAALFKYIPPVENIRWPFHYFVQLSILQILEHVPLCQNYYRIGAQNSLIHLLQLPHVSPVRLLPQLLPFHLIDKLSYDTHTFYNCVWGSKICRCAPSYNNRWQIYTAGDSRGSLVSFLKAVPRMHTFLCLMLKFNVSKIRSKNLRFR